MNNTLISYEEIKEVFYVEGHQDVFDYIFYPKAYTELGIASKLKSWMEYLGFAGSYVDYVRISSLANKWMNEQQSFKNMLGNLGLNLFEDVTVRQHYFFYEDKTDLFNNHESFEREFKLEIDLQKALKKSFENISDKWQVETEKFINNGTTDLLFTLDDNQMLAVELKKGPAQRKDIYQTYDYKGTNTETAIIAKSFDDDVISLAEKMGVSCYYYSLEDSLRPIFIAVTRQSETKSKLFDRILKETYENDGVWVDYPFPETPTDLEEKINEINAHELGLIDFLQKHVRQTAELYGIDLSKEV